MSGIVSKKADHKKDEAFLVRVSPEMKKRVDRVVEQTGQTVAEAIRQLLSAALDLHEGRRK